MVTKVVSLPLSRRTTNNYSIWDTTERILNIGVILKHPIPHKGQDRLALEGKRSDYTLTALPFLQLSAAPQGEVSPEPLVSSVRKENLGWQTPLPSIVSCFAGTPTPILHHEDCREICMAQPLEIWLWQSREEGLAMTSKEILADWVHICKAQI